MTDNVLSYLSEHFLCVIAVNSGGLNKLLKKFETYLPQSCCYGNTIACWITFVLLNTIHTENI